MKMGTRVMLSYLIVLVLGFALSAAIAYFSVNIQFTQKVKQELSVSADNITDTINNASVSQFAEDEYSETALRWSYLRLVNKLSDGIVVITGPSDSILFSNDDVFYKGGKFNISGVSLENEQMAQISFNNTHYLITKRKLNLTEIETFDGNIYFLVSMSEVNAVSNGVFLSFLPGLAISLAIALVIALLMTRSIIRPVRMLSAYASAIQPNSKASLPKIKASPEIKDLAGVLDSMSTRLDTFYTQQNQSLHNLSHELKSPLMSIQGYAEGIRDGVIDNREDVDGALGVIVDETQRLKTMVDQLILLGKIQSDTPTPLAAVSLANVVQNAMNSVGGLAFASGVKIHLQMQDVMTYAHAEKLEMAITNLLSNCIKYARHNVFIDISQGENEAVIKIYDDGEGFSQKDLAHMFDRFYSGAKDGTGLGLHIAKTIVSAYQGTIKAQNTQNGGACFLVTLPVK